MERHLWELDIIGDDDDFDWDEEIIWPKAKRRRRRLERKEQEK